MKLKAPHLRMFVRYSLFPYLFVRANSFSTILIIFLFMCNECFILNIIKSNLIVLWMYFFLFITLSVSAVLL